MIIKGKTIYEILEDFDSRLTNIEVAIGVLSLRVDDDLSSKDFHSAMAEIVERSIRVGGYFID